MIKRGIAVLLILIFAAAFAGCADNKPNTADNAATADQVTEAPTEAPTIGVDNASLEGTWVGDFETWKINKDGSGEITENGGDASAKFEYELPGGNIIIIRLDSADDSQKASCVLTEKTLILDFEDGKYFELHKK